MAGVKDKEFPILFILIAIIATFGIPLLISSGTTITGQAIGSEIPFTWTLPWILLIIFAIIAGIIVLREEKRL